MRLIARIIVTALGGCNKNLRSSDRSCIGYGWYASEIVAILITFFYRRRFATYAWQFLFCNEIIWLFLFSILFNFSYARLMWFFLVPWYRFCELILIFFLLLCHFSHCLCTLLNHSFSEDWKTRATATNRAKQRRWTKNVGARNEREKIRIWKRYCIQLTECGAKTQRQIKSATIEL